MTTSISTQEQSRSATLALRCRIATIDDVGAIVALLEAAHLPSRGVEPFIRTFVVAELDGRVVGCGGLELHEDTAVVRSVAIAEHLRGLGIGRRIWLRLEALARSFFVSEFYLFTADATPFWRKCGFEDIEIEDWREPARASWQWAYVSEHQEWARSMEVRSMVLHVMH